jgi:DNA-binding transcriptional LysR family regulator
MFTKETTEVHRMPTERRPAQRALSTPLDLNLLRIFATVYRFRQVTAAASELGMTPSAVSNALARLRTHCDDKLFVRTQRGVVPTAFATRLAESVQGGLDLFNAGLQAKDAVFTPASCSRMFRINLADVGQMLMIGEIVSQLAREAPEVTIRTTDHAVIEAEQALVGGDLDLAVGYIPNIGKSLHSRKITSETYVCVVARSSRRHAKGVSLKSYFEGTHIRYSPKAVSLSRLNVEVDRVFQKAGQRQHVVLEAAHSFGLSAIVANSNYILTVPSRLAAHYARISPVAVHPLPFRLASFDISLYWHAREQQDPAHQWFRQLFVDAIRAGTD